MLSDAAQKWRFGSRPKPTTKATVLCVDEDEELLRLRKGVLEDAGYAVLIASSGGRALELLSDSQVSLVLLGNLARAISGTELSREMKRIKPEVPVVLYTGKLPDSLSHVDGFINHDESRPNFLALIAGFVRSYRERMAS